MARGAFITIEGGEGVGKTSSLNAIETFLEARGIDVRMTREPGGTSLGEAVRDWILDGDHGRLGAEVEALLMFAARAQHIEQLIRPTLADGTWIVCDRFTDATLAYQGGGRGADPDWLRSIAAGIEAGLKPDLTLLLDAPVEIGMARIAGRRHDHFEREAAPFFERVRRCYLELAEASPERFRVIDAGASQASVREAIERELDSFCERFDARMMASA
ncbi:MAG TPA: dTMP kinase [Gammaproteobacteria bacterium]|nr:dTMP kinase [Gammaproteobacteria bacterium]